MRYALIASSSTAILARTQDLKGVIHAQMATTMILLIRDATIATTTRLSHFAANVLAETNAHNAIQATDWELQALQNKVNAWRVMQINVRSVIRFQVLACHVYQGFI